MSLTLCGGEAGAAERTKALSFFFTIRNVVVVMWHIFLFAQSIAFFFSFSLASTHFAGLLLLLFSSINLCYFGISILSLFSILLRNIFLSLLSCIFTTPFVAIDDRSREETFVIVSSCFM